MKKYIISFAFLQLSASVNDVNAQSKNIIQKIKLANQLPNMEYDYNMYLFDVMLKEKVDSTKGHLRVKDGQYVDSNGYALTARVGDYFCKLDHVQHTATICNMPELSKRTGIKFVNDEFKVTQSITDTFLNNESNLIIDSSDSKFYRIKIRTKNHSLSYAQMDFWRSNYKLAGAYFETEMKSNDEPQFNRLTSIHIRNVKHLPDNKGFDLKWVFNLVSNKPTLTKKYSTYKLIPLEN
ncbi:MAG: hypothetical protein V4561_01545 [Bacteroidota bacterium]